LGGQLQITVGLKSASNCTTIQSGSVRQHRGVAVAVDVLGSWIVYSSGHSAVRAQAIAVLEKMSEIQTVISALFLFIKSTKAL
jgi:hypothetical protein